MTLSSGHRHALARSRSRRRRRWTDAEKRRIVAECEEPGASVSIVACRHDLNANLLFTWRRQLGRKSAAGPEPRFVPAVIAANDAGPLDPPTAVQEPRGRLDNAALRQRPGVIEIVLAGGRRVIVEEWVSAAALARVIDVLAGR